MPVRDFTINLSEKERDQELERRVTQSSHRAKWAEFYLSTLQIWALSPRAIEKVKVYFAWVDMMLVKQVNGLSPRGVH